MDCPMHVWNLESIKGTVYVSLRRYEGGGCVENERHVFFSTDGKKKNQADEHLKVSHL